MKRILISLLALAAGCMLGGCPPRGAPLPAAYQPLTPEKIDTTAVRAHAKTLSADIRITHFEGKQRLRGTAGAVFARPDRFRIEIQGAIATGAAMSCDGTSLFVLDTHARTFQAGSADNVQTQLGMLPMAMSCHDFVQLLFGHLPGINMAQPPPNATLRYDQATSRIIMSYLHGGRRWVAYFAPDGAPPATLRTLSVYASTAEDEQQLLWTVRVEAYSRHGGIALPSQLEFKTRSPAIETTLKLRDVELNIEVDEDLFELSCPNGYRCGR